MPYSLAFFVVENIIKTENYVVLVIMIFTIYIEIMDGNLLLFLCSV